MRTLFPPLDLDCIPNPLHRPLAGLEPSRRRSRLPMQVPSYPRPRISLRMLPIPACLCHKVPPLSIQLRIDLCLLLPSNLLRIHLCLLLPSNLFSWTESHFPYTQGQTVSVSSNFTSPTPDIKSESQSIMSFGRDVGLESSGTCGM